MSKIVPASSRSTPRRRKSVQPPSPARPTPAQPSGRHVELEYLRNHSLQEYAGQWVVLERDEIVVHGDDAPQVVDEARRKGVEVPFVFYVEPDYGDKVVRMGL